MSLLDELDLEAGFLQAASPRAAPGRPRAPAAPPSLVDAIDLEAGFLGETPSAEPTLTRGAPARPTPTGDPLRMGATAFDPTGSVLATPPGPAEPTPREESLGDVLRPPATRFRVPGITAATSPPPAVGLLRAWRRGLGMEPAQPEAAPADIARAQIELEARQNLESPEAYVERMSGESALTPPFRRVIRTHKGLTRGALGVGEGLGQFGRLVGDVTGSDILSASAREAEDAFGDAAAKYKVSNPDFFDHLAEGAGSMAAFMVPVVGQEAAVATLPLRAARIVRAVTAASTEAMSEAGNVYAALTAQGMDKNEAAKRAGATFAANEALLTVTNKLGLFSEAGRAGWGQIKRVLKTAALEGPLQEGPQQIVQDVASGQPIDWSAVGEQSAIGALVGGGASVATNAAERRRAPGRPIPVAGEPTVDVRHPAIPEEAPVLPDRVLLSQQMKPEPLTTPLEVDAERGADRVRDGADRGGGVLYGRPEQEFSDVDREAARAGPEAPGGSPEALRGEDLRPLQERGPGVPDVAPPWQGAPGRAPLDRETLARELQAGAVPPVVLGEALDARLGDPVGNVPRGGAAETPVAKRQAAQPRSLDPAYGATLETQRPAPRLATVVETSSGILRLEFHRDVPVTAEDVASLFPDQAVSVAPRSGGLRSDVAKFDVVFRNAQGRIDGNEARGALDRLGGVLFREPPSTRQGEPDQRTAYGTTLDLADPDSIRAFVMAHGGLQTDPARTGEMAMIPTDVKNNRTGAPWDVLAQQAEAQGVAPLDLLNALTDLGNLRRQKRERVESERRALKAEQDEATEQTRIKALPLADQVRILSEQSGRAQEDIRAEIEDQQAQDATFEDTLAFFDQAALEREALTREAAGQAGPAGAPAELGTGAGGGAPGRVEPGGALPEPGRSLPAGGVPERSAVGLPGGAGVGGAGQVNLGRGRRRGRAAGGALPLGAEAAPAGLAAAAGSAPGAPGARRAPGRRARVEEQARIPGTAASAVPSTLTRATAPQADVTTAPLFGQERAAREAEVAAAQTAIQPETPARELTKEEAREARRVALEKSFADRPTAAMKYGDPAQSQGWQVLEPDYIEQRFIEKQQSYERALPAQRAKVEAMKPTSRQRTTEEAALRYWEKMAERYANHDPILGQEIQASYRDMVKKAVSQGKPVPKEVIQQHSEFVLAQTARERYEKGRHTSFANVSVAVNDTMQAEHGFKVKRQDGHQITDVQIQEIVDGVNDVIEIVGPGLRDAMRGTNLTIAHTNGKHPFLSDAGGEYHPTERSISMGINDFLGRPVRALAHELGHWMDYEAGRALGTTTTVFTKSHKAIRGSHYVSEVDGHRLELFGLANRTMTDTREVERALKKTNLDKLSDGEHAEVERMKVILGPYWRTPRELWARMFEQYVGTKLDRAGLSADGPAAYQKAPGWWDKAAFSKLEPMIERELGRRLDALSSQYGAPVESAPAVEEEPGGPALDTTGRPLVEERPGEAGFLRLGGREVIPGNPEIKEMNKQAENKPDLRTRLGRVRERIITTQVNRFYPLKALGDAAKTGGQQFAEGSTPMEWAEITNARAAGRFDAWLTSAERVMAPIQKGGLEEVLNDYLTMKQMDKRIRDLHTEAPEVYTAQGRNTETDTLVNPRGFDKAKITAGLRDLKGRLTPEQHTAVTAAADQWWALNREVLDAAHDAGIIADEVHEKIVGRGDDYVPFQVLDYLADLDHASRSPGPRPLNVRYQDYLRKMAGTERDVANVIGASVEKAMKGFMLAERNLAVKQVTKLATVLPDVIQKVPGDTFTVPGEQEILSVFENGARENYAVPKDIAATMLYLDEVQLDLFGKFLSYTASPLRFGATSGNVGFSVTNLPRDWKRMLYYSKYGAKSPLDIVRAAYNWGEGVAAVYNKSDVYLEALRSGALYTTVQKHITGLEQLSRRTGRLSGDQGISVGRLKDSIVNGMSWISNLMEESTKLATFIRGQRQGASGQELAYEVANYGGSPNFARAGTWGKQLNVLAMFFNARLQGTAGNIRRIRETKGKAAGKVALARLGLILAPMTALAYLWNAQFDDDHGLDEIDDRDKQKFFILLFDDRLSNMLGQGPALYQHADGTTRRKHLKLAKEEGEQILVPILEAGLDLVRGKNDRVSAAKITSDLLGNLSPISIQIRDQSPRGWAEGIASGALSGLNPALRIPAELGMNYAAYRQSPIESKAAEGVLPPERVKPTTSPSMIAVANVLGWSPTKLEYAVTSATGGLGRGVLDEFDKRVMGKAQPDTGSDWEGKARLPVVGRLLGTGGNAVDRATEDELYKIAEEARQTKGSMKAVTATGDEARVEQLIEDRPLVLQSMAGELHGLTKSLGDIHKIQVWATHHLDADADTKKEILAALAEERHGILEVFRALRDGTGNFSFAGGGVQSDTEEVATR